MLSQIKSNRLPKEQRRHFISLVVIYYVQKPWAHTCKKREIPEIYLRNLFWIFTIFYRFSQFTHFCRDLHFVAIYAIFPQFFFGQNSLLRNITRFLHVCLGPALIAKLFKTAKHIQQVIKHCDCVTLGTHWSQKYCL